MNEISLSTLNTYISTTIASGTTAREPPSRRPDGSAIFLNAASHSNAIGVLHATEGSDGTHFAAASDREVLRVDRAIEVLLLAHRWVDREALGSLCKLLVAHLRRCEVAK